MAIEADVTVTELIMRWCDESPERRRWFEENQWESDAALSAAHAVLNSVNGKALAQCGDDVGAAQAAGVPPAWVKEGLRPFRVGGDRFYPLP